MDLDEGREVGLVIGTEDATPLDFWTGMAPGEFLQLDDVVRVERVLPGGEKVSIYGVVNQVRARMEGARFGSDAFLIREAVLPGEVFEAAQIATTRIEPEVFVPPLPGSAVTKASGAARDEALFFDKMARKLPAGLSRSGELIYLNLDFLDGSQGAHVNISGISGVATKTSYATFLLYSLFNSGALGAEALNTKALIFNVKGEDLLFLDHPNIALSEEERSRYKILGLEPGPFTSVGFFAPPRKGSSIAKPDVTTRDTGVTSFFWTLEAFCKEELLPFLFVDAEDERNQYSMVVSNVVAQLKKADPLPEGGVRVDGVEVRTFRQLVDVVVARVQDDDSKYAWAGPAMGMGTINAFVKRLNNAVRDIEPLVRADIPGAEAHRVKQEHQVTVVDLHNLKDRAKRFVVGVVLRAAFQQKEETGQAKPMLLVVLDELNKYAPKQGWSPIKEILLDVAERGRSLGIILIGAQQTASEVEDRIVGQSSIRVVGRLDSAEAEQGEYGFLRGPQRQRATIIKSGTMMVSQPDIPIPLVVEFPFPAWASRKSEAGPAPGGSGEGDPFRGLA